MDYSNLFGWWITSITFNILFVIFASVYLYRRRKTALPAVSGGNVTRWVKDFTFVWILLGLLILYVVSVGQGSYVLFAAGNIAIEIILIYYIVRSGSTRPNPSVSNS